MEVLFNFLHIRPAVEPDDEDEPLTVETDSDFQQEIMDALGEDQPRSKVKQAATAFAGSDRFARGLKALHFHRALIRLRRELDSLEREDTVDHAAVESAAQTAFDQPLDQVVSDPEFSEDLQRLRDSVLAIKLLPEKHKSAIHHMGQAIRDMTLLQRAADDAGFPADARALRRHRRKSMLLPEGLALDSGLKSRPRENGTGSGDEERRKAFDRELEHFRALVGAAEELNHIEGRELQQSDVRSSQGSLPATELRPRNMLQQAIKQGFSPYFSPVLGRAGTPPDTRAAFAASDDQGLAGLLTSPMIQSLSQKERAPLTARFAMPGRSALEPTNPLETSLKLTPDAAQRLSAPTRAVLEERQIDITDTSMEDAVNRLQGEARQVASRLDRLADPGVHRSFRRMGNTLVMINTPIDTRWTQISLGTLPGLMFPVPDIGHLFPDDRIPHTHGEVEPAGVADLLIIKQQLKRYEAWDVAHIENVLQGEKKEREHTRRKETEEFSLLETEKSTTEEHDLQSTNRYEMARETRETIRQESSLKAGLQISGKYGPTVEFSASTEGSVSSSKEKAKQSATRFSQEVTERSARRISERVLERESRRVTTEITERNLHGLDNVGGDGHIRGIYQWVEKVYEAQVFNYGLRTMFEFMVPEPGAFLIETLRRAHASTMELEKPAKFTLRPDEITEYNYHNWVVKYQATDVDPPPEPYITRSHTYSAGNGDEKTDFNHSAEIDVEDGFRAVFATVAVVGNVWDDEATVDVAIGQRVNRIEDAGIRVWHTSLDNERGNVPFALNTFNQSDIAVAVEVKAQRTDRAMAQWRHDTHAKLTEAYRARLAEYEEKLAALKAQTGVAIEGKSPSLNRQLMEDELKKACISIITEQHYDLFDAIETGSNGLPQVDLFENEAEGPYVRFLEQSFEWEHMTWITYPYFWGRKSQWPDRVAMEDDDPLFNEFLKAGYCRVVVPVRPGFEGAVDHFMHFGEPWLGGPLPSITSDLYLPIAEEIAERLDRPGEEIPEGEPWEVRLPTDLVRLRDDGSLPAWEKNEDGTWSPVD